jgi:hypothetical protein
MRKLVLALGVSTAAFAASTLYFWRDLQVERSRPQVVASAPTIVSAKDTPEKPPPTPGNSAAMTQPPTVPVASNRPDAAPAWTETDAEARARSLAHMRTVFEDPLKREETMRVSRDGFRRAFPRLAEHLGLTEDQYTRLVNQLAEHQMHWAERRYRCLLEPDCDEMSAMKGIGAERERELTDIIGPEKYQQFSEYLDNQQERRAVMRLRGELPDALRMTDVQAEKLVAALGEERRRTLKEWEQRGTDVEAMNSEYGEVYHSGNSDEFEQRFAEAKELQRRQHDRAAQILTAGQLKVFDERQAAALEQARGVWQSPPQEGNTQ